MSCSRKRGSHILVKQNRASDYFKTVAENFGVEIHTKDVNKCYEMIYQITKHHFTVKHKIIDV